MANVSLSSNSSLLLTTITNNGWSWVEEHVIHTYYKSDIQGVLIHLGIKPAATAPKMIAQLRAHFATA